MTRIFVFTAGNREARKHLADSIESPIDDEEYKVFGGFPSGQHLRLRAATRQYPVSRFQQIEVHEVHPLHYDGWSLLVGA